MKMEEEIDAQIFSPYLLEISSRNCSYLEPGDLSIKAFAYYAKRTYETRAGVVYALANYAFSQGRSQNSICKIKSIIWELGMREISVSQIGGDCFMYVIPAKKAYMGKVDSDTTINVLKYFAECEPHDVVVKIDF